ncbi:MAG: OmpA family protein [Planctomycetaceae bacterium]|jgi:chemotaxis protein MotB|nr:OmpA family protein [Planctomycetaceae bacterium]
MARPKPPEEGVPLWIVSFGDMMSLLLCFFVLLFSMSTLEIPKIAAAIEALNTGFGYHGDGQSTNFEVVKKRVEQMMKTMGDKRPITPIIKPPIAAPPGDQIRINIPNVIQETTMGYFAWFDFNSDELTEQAKLNLAHAKDEFAGSQFVIIIKGRASAKENLPYRSSFTLAFTRANNVRDYLIGLGLEPSVLQVSVVGNFEPIERVLVPFEVEPAMANSVVQVILTKETPRNRPGFSEPADANNP